MTQSQTPLWKEDPHKAALMTDDCEWVDVSVITAAMYEAVVNEELGDGTIYEVTRDRTRVVPEYNSPPPSGYGLGSGGYAGEKQTVLDMLKGPGLQT